MATTVHSPVPGSERTDVYGSWAQVLCGVQGSYYSHRHHEVTCEDCSELLAAAELSGVVR